MSNVEHYMQPKEEIIGTRFIPVIARGYIRFDNEQKFLALPIKFDELGFLNYCEIQNSRETKKPLKL